MTSTWKWILGILAILILGLIIAGSVLSRIGKPKLQQKLSQQVNQASSGLYTVRFEDMDFQLWSGTVALQHVELRVDTGIYTQLARERRAPNVYFQGKLEEVRLQGISLWSLIMNKTLRAHRLFVNGLTLQVQQSREEVRDTVADHRSLYQRVKSRLQEVHINKIETRNLTMDWISNRPGQDTLRIHRLQALGEHFLINAESDADSTRIYYMENVSLQLPTFTYDIPQSPYRAQFDSLDFDSREARAEFHHVEIQPRIPPLTYFQQDKENKALIHLKWDRVTLEDMHIDALMSRRLLWAERATLEKGSTQFFKDKRYQKDTVNKIGDAPHQQIMKMAQKIRFDTVWVERIDLLYQQHSDTYPAEGQITFQDAHGYISNLTNDTTRLTADPLMRADLSASIMAQGLLQAQFGFEMLSPRGNHRYKGTLSSMPATAFNRILRPLLNIEIESGNIKGIQFDIQASDQRHQGEFRFDYDDFAVNILHAPHSSGSRDKKGILSFLANKVLINDSNPDANGKYHLGQIDYERVADYSHFKSIWKALQDGILESMGINPKYIPDF